MKGMNTKLILNEPDTLKAKLLRACTEHGVPDDKRDSIITNGQKLFTVDDAGLITQSFFQWCRKDIHNLNDSQSFQR